MLLTWVGELGSYLGEKELRDKAEHSGRVRAFHNWFWVHTSDASHGGMNDALRNPMT